MAYTMHHEKQIDFCRRDFNLIQRLRSQALFRNRHWKEEVALLQQDPIRPASKESTGFLRFPFLTEFHQHMVGRLWMEKHDHFVVSTRLGLIG